MAASVHWEAPLESRVATALTYPEGDRVETEHFASQDGRTGAERRLGEKKKVLYLQLTSNDLDRVSWIQANKPISYIHTHSIRQVASMCTYVYIHLLTLIMM